MTLNFYHENKKTILSLFFINPIQLPCYDYYSTKINNINQIDKCITEDNIFRKYIILLFRTRLHLTVNLYDTLEFITKIGGNKIKLRSKLYYCLFVNNKYYKIYYYYTYTESKGINKSHNYSIYIEYIKHEIIYGDPIYFMDKTRNKLLNIFFFF